MMFTYNNFHIFSINMTTVIAFHSMDRLTLFHLRQHSRCETLQTASTIQQTKTEKLVQKAYCEKLGEWKDSAFMLAKICHINYLTRKLSKLPTSLEMLDASQPWLAYWIVHALRLLNFTVPDGTKESLIRFLKSTHHPDGGFGGGPYQFAHLATTYAAVNCLVSLCERAALDVIDRDALYRWLLRVRRPDGSFCMQVGGEVDVRGAYCAISVSRITGLTKRYPELFKGTAEWIASCQTYEGGFGGSPGLEAHGGYTYCGVAALILLGRPELMDVPRLLRWLAHRQMSNEGGFQGRTNKLVDSCYSFWLGACFPLLEEVCTLAGDTALSPDESLFNTSALQEYILLCCQKVSFNRAGLSVRNSAGVLDSPFPTAAGSPSDGGGLIDKPGKNPDPYHTCYALSGLSVAQHSPRRHSAGSSLLRLGEPRPVKPVDLLACHDAGADSEGDSNELVDLDLLHNLLHDGLVQALAYFNSLDRGLSGESADRMAQRTASEQQQQRVSSSSRQAGLVPMPESGQAEETLGVDICASFP